MSSDASTPSAEKEPPVRTWEEMHPRDPAALAEARQMLARSSESFYPGDVTKSVPRRLERGKSPHFVPQGGLSDGRRRSD